MIIFWLKRWVNCSCRIPRTASWVESGVTPLTRLSTLWFQRETTRLCHLADGDEFNDDGSDDNQNVLEQKSDENVQHGLARQTGVSFTGRRTTRFILHWSLQTRFCAKNTKIWFINGVDNVNWPPYKDWKADVSSVSPPSEQIEKLWVV